MDRVQNDVIKTINNYYRELMAFDNTSDMYITYRWALVTLKKEILVHQNEPPLLVIERFYDELQSYCHLVDVDNHKKTKTWCKFNYARDAVRHVMRLLGVR